MTAKVARTIARTNLLRHHYYEGTMTESMMREYARLTYQPLKQVRAFASRPMSK